MSSFSSNQTSKKGDDDTTTVDNNKLKASSVNINTELLERLRCYRTGYIDYGHVKRTTSDSCPFANAGALLPYQIDHRHYRNVPSPPVDQGEAAAAEAINDDTNNYVEEVLEKAKYLSKSKEELLQEFAPIQRSIAYDKPIAIVCNPASGNKRDVRNEIRTTLEIKGKISVEFFATKYPMHAWDIVAKEIDLTNYSAIAAVGGDGTFHEVVNGLLAYKNSTQKEELPPVAFIPNGTGNDFLANFGVQTVSDALEAILKGDVIAVDCNLITMDATKADEIPPQEYRSRVRYSIANSAVGFLARVNQKAQPLKPHIGGLAYSITGLKELLFANGSIPKYDLKLQQPATTSTSTSTASRQSTTTTTTTNLSNIETLFLAVNTGKYMGGHGQYTPTAMLNDGLLDIVYKKGSFSVAAALTLLDQATRLRGNHVFHPDVYSYRARSIQIAMSKTNNNNNNNKSSKINEDDETQMIQIDGENLVFHDYVNIQSVPAAINIIVDYDKAMSIGPMITTNNNTTTTTDKNDNGRLAKVGIGAVAAVGVAAAAAAATATMVSSSSPAAA